jgi:DNA replicative helicase MCM subunit Mcm2 (Cdc46/Mcm family)
LKKIDELAKKDDIYEILANNLAPSIFGHSKIKDSRATTGI